MILVSRTMSILMKLLYPASRQQKMLTQQLVIRHQQYADQIHPGYAKLRKIQARFQVDDGCPIHLKKGLSDKIPYYATLILCVIGMGMNFKGYYELANPKPKKSSDDEEE